MAQPMEIPREHLQSMIELRDRIRAGEIALARQLRYYLEKYGLFHGSAFQRLLELGRRAFDLRSRQDAVQLRAEIESLATFPVTNDAFGAKVKTWINFILEAENRGRLMDRLTAFAAFMAEFDFHADPLITEIVGARLFQEWKDHKKGKGEKARASRK